MSKLNLPIQVAVMGCVVNGPGEARHADLGIAAGKKRGHLFIKGQIVRVVKEDEMVEALVEEATDRRRGRRSATRRARPGAEAEAEADRAMLLEDRGADVNHANERSRKSVDASRELKRRLQLGLQDGQRIRERIVAHQAC